MGEKPRILIIEDDAFYREFLLRTLDRDYRIEVAEDGMQALTTLSLHHSHDVILCDLRMPGISGKELIQRIRQLADEDAVLIIVTGFEQDWSPVDATDAQVFSYLKKGQFGPKDLRKVIENGLAQRRRRQESRQQASRLQEVKKELEGKVAEGSRALSESEAKYRQLFEQSLVGIYIEQDNRVRLANDKLCEILGCRSKTLMRKSIRDFILPAQKGELHTLGSEEEGASGSMQEITLKNSKGAIRNVLHCAGAIRFQGASAVQGCMLDITDWKLMEQQLLQHQKMESLGTLIGGITHEFNNILAAILPQTELLIQRANQFPSIQRPAEILFTMASKASRLTRQLLNMSRRASLEKMPLEVNNWLRESLSLLATTIGPSVSLELDLHPEAGRIEADPQHLDQVLLNLVLNARDAMPKGGKVRISTSLCTAQTLARAGLRERGAGFVEITVEDFGCGIPAEQLGKIFDPFFTTKEAGKGTGLGLSVVYNLVKQHGGEILVTSKPGQGSTFRILFPCLAPLLRDRPQDSKPCGTVLVADPGPGMLDLFRDVLGQMRYEVIPARNPEQAVEIYSRQREAIDWVILDGRSGDRARLDSFTRLLDLNPGIKMILTQTGSADPIDLTAETAGNRGANVRYLRVPATAETLTRSLRKVLQAGNV
jgi:PAS domain S-box-containing protein